MNILIINCHTDNRGDEAAVHALVDELNCSYDNLRITLAMRGDGRYPNLPENVTSISQFIPAGRKAIIANCIAIVSKGKINISRKEKNLVTAVNCADIILHAPGGPSIGDTYYAAEPTYLRIFDLIKALNKPYMFYAPSMGPFNCTKRSGWRKRILKGAEAIVLRDPISAEHVKRLLPDKKIYQTMDSALQHDIDLKANSKKYEEFADLHRFVTMHEKCVGITITDLMWHPVHSKNSEIQNRIRGSFENLLSSLVNQGYGIVFIPQLYDLGNDYDLMKTYCTNKGDYFIIPTNDKQYDAYFQQHVIGQLYAVIGMRYHSNIFSAKMGTPFISISYEQKMQGFMEKLNLQDYCIKLNDLSEELINNKFGMLINNYETYKEYLQVKHCEMKSEAFRTTEILKCIIDSIIN